MTGASIEEGQSGPRPARGNENDLENPEILTPFVVLQVTPDDDGTVRPVERAVDGNLAVFVPHCVRLRSTATSQGVPAFDAPDSRVAEVTLKNFGLVDQGPLIVDVSFGFFVDPPQALPPIVIPSIAAEGSETFIVDFREVQPWIECEAFWFAVSAFGVHTPEPTAPEPEWTWSMSRLGIVSFLASSPDCPELGRRIRQFLGTAMLDPARKVARASRDREREE